ncbi:hypothetical protein MLD38_033613 [Melastoma candidum]|uniref:Uncharacterized protein n=1 Tax=Melastoma candidum TaxID=119954 RepID=A0ACB9M8N6_9MYRT|nr:hypothetical protein MLD38_033613 [Melastoma candidum]
MAVMLRKSLVGKQTVLSSASTLPSIPRHSSPALPFTSGPRHSHSSMGDQDNPDDPPGSKAVVPDRVPEDQPEDYWIPHPETGLFVPPADQDVFEDVDGGSGSLTEHSVLEQHAFFRPSSIEDPDKPVSLESLAVEVEVEVEMHRVNRTPVPPQRDS